MVKKSDYLKSIVIAVLTIVVCVGIVTASTLAVFTSSMLVENHLEAGTLNVKLERTKLEKTGLNDDGLLETYPVDNSVIEYTGKNTVNVLGLGTDELIVPGLDCKSTLRLTNGGNIAFTYNIKLVVKGDAAGAMNALGEQLVFTAVTEEGTYSKTFGEIGLNNYVIASGSMLVGDPAETFTVQLQFKDYDKGPGADTVLGTTNNKAQGKSFYFDIVIEAVQRTK